MAKINQWQVLKDKLNHEYWPLWLVYWPILPLWLYYAIKNRSLVFFTVANPAIDMGGFFGESKQDIYKLLPDGSYPKTLTFDDGIGAEQIHNAIEQQNMTYPLIIKPDVGERGHGVVLAHDTQELCAAVNDAVGTFLVQEYINWSSEFGVLIAKHPQTGKVTITSITGKAFLSVTGNGTSTVAQLLAQFYRGQKQLPRLSAVQPDLLQLVPKAEEQLVIEPIGNHSRGTTFLDARHLNTPALVSALEQLLAAAPGFYFGRLDVKAPSAHALSQGVFKIIEFNGVSSEPGHIYDPRLYFWQAWAGIWQHGLHIGRVSSALIAQGHAPISLLALVLRCQQHFDIKLPRLVKWLGYFSRQGTPALSVHKG